MDIKQHQYGSGELSFAQFAAGTQNPGLREYLGNTPEFTTTTEQETLDHWDVDHGLRVKDDSVVTQIDQSGALTIDNISVENLAMWLLGSSAVLTQTSLTAQTENVTVDKYGTHQLGVTSGRPTGFRKITVTTITSNPTGTTYTAGADYVVDGDRGTVTFLKGGAIDINDPVIITFNVAASSRPQVVSGSKVIEGALHFKSYNAVGKKIDYFYPWVKLTPNGDFNPKPGDEWVTLPFSIEILKKGDLEAVYADGQAVTA